MNNIFEQKDEKEYEELQKQNSDVFGEQDDENENTDAGEGKAKSEKSTRKTKTQVKDKPNRSLPKLIEELLNKNIKVGLSKNGYLVYGFYGLNDDGYAELLESKDNKDILVSYDNRKKEHVIQTFEDLVRFNGLIWKVYKKQKEHRQDLLIWLNYLVEYECIDF